MGPSKMRKAKWPCGKCTKDTDKTESLFCEYCNQWSHATCEQITSSQLKQLTSSPEEYICSRCRNDGDRFDYLHGLARLTKAAKVGIDKLREVCRREKIIVSAETISSLDANIPNPLQLDQVADDILKFQTTEPCDRAARASGDGHCLFNAISSHLIGDESLSVELRYRTCIEMVLNPVNMTKHPHNASFILLSPPVSESMLSCANLGDGYSSVWTVIALANVIKRAIRLIYPSINGPTDLPFVKFNTLFKPPGCDKSPLKLLWTSTIPPPKKKGSRMWVPNHFVPVVPSCSITKTMSYAQSVKTTDNSSEAPPRVEHVSKPSITTRKTDSNAMKPVDTVRDMPASHRQYVIPKKTSTNFLLDISTESLLSENRYEILSSDFDSDNDSTTDTDTHSISRETTRTVHDIKTENGSETNSDTDSTTDSETDIRDISDKVQTTETKTETITETDTNRGNLDGKFLDTDAVYSLLVQGDCPLDKIPRGVKENQYYLVDNTVNRQKRQNNAKSTFSDDCGVWNTASGSSPKTTYILTESGSLKKIFVRNGVYCTERVVKKERQYLPIEPSPNAESLVILHRYYTSLKADKNYKKRVTWLGTDRQHDKKDCAVVEYLGKFPGLIPHGNSQQTDGFVRTDDNVMTEIGNLGTTMKPLDVYRKLNLKYDDSTGPTHPRQVRDKKRNDNVKERKTNGQFTNRQNIADHFIQLQDMVREGHPMVRQVLHDHGKTPAIILYTDEQMTDIKHLCCSGQTIWGFDKTFNLCDMHVTASCFKHLSLEKPNTGEPPLFFGPVFIHDSSDFETYSAFFAHLKIKLTGTDLTKLVIGTDDEQAMKKAVTYTFPDSTHVLCTRHLRQNALDKMTNLGVPKTDRKRLINDIFGNEGVTDADDSMTFDDRCDDLLATCQSISPDFADYFTKRLKSLLNTKVNEPQRLGHIEKQWTNNNCESINHVLKHLVDWKSKPLVEFVEALHDLIQVQYKDLRRAIISTGQYRLTEQLGRYRTDKVRWVSLTADQKDRLVNKVKRGIVREGVATSTDGLSKYRLPRTLGRKPGQRKRPRTERTLTVPKKKLKC